MTELDIKKAENKKQTFQINRLRIKYLKKRFNISFSEIGRVYYLHKDGKLLVAYPSSKDAKFARDRLIEEQLNSEGKFFSLKKSLKTK